MIPVPSIAGLAGCALVPIAAIMRVKGIGRLPIKARCVILAFLFGFAFFPFKGIPLAGYLRSLTGDLSITTLVLVILSTVSRLVERDLYKRHSFPVLMIVVAAGGLFLYPFALGLTGFDPYSLGYHSKVFLAFLFCVAAAAWYFGFYLILFCVIFAVSGFLFGIYESRNLWDYLIDPLIVTYALFWLPFTIIQRKRKGVNGHEKY